MKIRRIAALSTAVLLLVASLGGCTKKDAYPETPSGAAEPVSRAASDNGGEEALPSLKDIYQNDFLIGTIYAEGSLSEQDTYLTTSQFNVITPENILKPEGLQKSEGTFTFDAGDKMMNYAVTNNLKVVGHNLCWHQQSPSWMGGRDVDSNTAIEQLRSHVTTVADHYKGEVISWDVLNEAIADGVRLPADGDWTKCLRQTQWLESIGPEYVAMVFQFAKEADPDCVLYYNDYNLEQKDKADIAYAMIKDLRAHGVPIEGIGLQGHLSTSSSTKGLKYAIELFSDLGIEISITEMDVTCDKVENGVLTEEGELEQAVKYAEAFQIFKEHSDVITRVTFWGTVDSQSWRGEQCPLLFDYNYNPKQAFYAVADPEGFLAQYCTDEPEIEIRRAQAFYGTPVVDGEEDDIWANTEEIQVDNQVLAWQGATGVVKALWDENNLYIMFHVKDPELSNESENAWEQDSVEIFLDQNNGKTDYYEEDDGQYRVGQDNYITFGTVPTQEGFVGIAVKENGGYRVEMQIPFLNPMEAGTVVGFDAQVNDASGAVRNAISKFNDPTDNSYMNTENWGELLLSQMED